MFMKASLPASIAAALATFAFAPAVGVAQVNLSIANCESPQLTGSNGSWTITCGTTTPPAPGVPSGCSLSANPSTLPSSGGVVNLTASCSSGSPTGYAWKKNGQDIPNASGSTYSETLGANDTPNNIGVSYSVVASNGTGPSNSFSRTVTVSGVGGGTVACNYPAKEDLTIPFQRGRNALSYGFANNMVLAAKITMPTTSSTLNGSAGRIAMYEWTDLTPTYRTAWVSTVPCGTPGDANTVKKPNGASAIYYGSAVSVYFSVGNKSSSSTALVLPAGQTVYVNVLNQKHPTEGSGPSCTSVSGTCNVAFELTLPAGL